tara:strand:+ start:587 stop:934 length:348 start_codon:yes stop_codon:yes gene_type:complete
MASTFKNAGMTVGLVDNSSANLFTAGASATAVIHALYVSNKSTTATATVNVKVSTDGGSTFYHIGKSLEVPPNNTLTLDKPVNLENNDIIRVIADPTPDSSSVDVEAYASILELT